MLQKPFIWKLHSISLILAYRWNERFSSMNGSFVKECAGHPACVIARTWSWRVRTPSQLVSIHNTRTYVTVNAHGITETRFLYHTFHTRNHDNTTAGDNLLSTKKRLDKWTQAQTLKKNHVASSILTWNDILIHPNVPHSKYKRSNLKNEPN